MQPSYFPLPPAPYWTEAPSHPPHPRSFAVLLSLGPSPVSPEEEGSQGDAGNSKGRHPQPQAQL